MSVKNYIKISNYRKFLLNNDVGQYWFEGNNWGQHEINYKINTSNHSLKIVSTKESTVFIISFYEDFPTFSVVFSDKYCSFTVQRLNKYVTICCDYRCENEMTLQSPEFLKIIYNQENNISMDDEKGLIHLLHKTDIEFPNVQEIINFLEEPKEILNTNHIKKLLEIVNETDPFNWHIIFNYFVIRQPILYLPPIII